MWVASEEMKRKTSISSRARSRFPETIYEERSSRDTQHDGAADPEKDVADQSTGPKLPPGVHLLPAYLPTKLSVYGM